MVDEKTFYINLGQSIRDFRKRENISQESLANHLSLSRISIVNIEKGKQKIQLYSLYLIAKHFKISIDQLVPEESIDIITEKVDDKVNKAGGAISSIEKVKGFIENL